MDCHGLRPRNDGLGCGSGWFALTQSVIARRSGLVTARSVSDAAVHESMDCHGLRPRNDGLVSTNGFQGLRPCNGGLVSLNDFHGLRPRGGLGCAIALGMRLVQQGQDVAVQGGGDVHAVGDAVGAGGVAAL